MRPFRDPFGPSGSRQGEANLNPNNRHHDFDGPVDGGRGGGGASRAGSVRAVRVPALQRPAQPPLFMPDPDGRRMSLSRVPAVLEGGGNVGIYDPSSQAPTVARPQPTPSMPTPSMPTPPSPAMSTAPESWTAEMMQKCGFEKDRVGLHWAFTEVLEKMWQDAGFVFTGNFAEGWGYSTVRVDGRCGYDSALTCKYIVPDYTVHIAGVCCCRQPVQKVVLNDDGSVTLNQDCIVHLRAMDLVRDDAVLMVGDMRRRATSSLGLTASGPALSLEQVFPCCRRPRLPRLEQLDMPDLSAQPVFIRPDEFEPQMSGRNAKPPTGRLDLSLLDRALFRKLSSPQGRLYVALKVLLLEELPRAKYLNSVCFSEFHCKQVLLHYLLARRRSGNVANDVHDALRLLMSSNSDGPLLRDSQMRSSTFPAAWIPLLSPCPAAQLLKALAALANDGEQILLERLRRLLSTPGDGGNLGIAIFQPMLLAIPGHKQQLSAGSAAARSLARCRDIAFLVYRVMERLLRPHLSDDIPDLQADIDAVRPLAGVTAVCLQCLMHLKLDEREPARATLRESRAAMQRVLREFPRNSTAESMEQILLSGMDCAWHFKAKLSVEEPQHANQLRARPQGTAFLAAFPLIRYVFFPCRVTPMQQMGGCIVEYALNINFLALMNCLVVQTVPHQTQSTELWRWFDDNKPLDAQELFALSLSDQQLDLHQLRRLCQRLNERLLPMRQSEHHQQQQHRPPEWDYLEHLRIRTLHRCIRGLPGQTRWGPEEVSACRQLGQLHASLPGSQSIASILAHVSGPDLSRDAAGRVLGQLRDFHLRETDNAFGRKLAKGLTGDLGRQFLAASLYSWYCLDSAKAKKYRVLLSTFNASYGSHLFPEQDAGDAASRLT